MENKKNLLRILVVLLVLTSMQLAVSSLSTKQISGHSPLILIINFLAGIFFAAFMVKPVRIKTRYQTFDLEDYPLRKGLFTILAFFMPWVFYLSKITWSNHTFLNLLPLFVLLIIFLFFTGLIYFIFIKRKFLKEEEKIWEPWEEFFIDAYYPIIAFTFLLLEVFVGYFFDNYLSFTPFPAIALILGTSVGFVFIDADKQITENAIKNNSKLYD